MKELLGYRALGSLCRQRAVFDPEHSWQWLGRAERWEHLAAAEIGSPFTVEHVPSGKAGDRPENKTNAAT